MIFDSLYDHYRGVVCFVRVVDGMLRKGMKVRFHATGRQHEVEEVGVLRSSSRRPPEAAGSTIKKTPGVRAAWVCGEARLPRPCLGQT